MPKTFEEYLEEQFIDNCEGILDDDMPDAEEDWISNLDGQEIIDYAEKWGKLQFEAGQKSVEDYAKSIAKDIN